MRKKLYSIFIFIVFLTLNTEAQNGAAINTTGSIAAPSAMLDISSTISGLLIPRMTINERNAISNPAEGLQIFNLESKCLEFYSNGIWRGICDFKCGIDSLYDNRDNNTYSTVKIGNQCWMKENLKYLPSVSTPGTGSASIPYYYVYSYNGTDVNSAKLEANYLTYGVLYNWVASVTACPPGWHIPNDYEWKQLELYIGISHASADSIGWRASDKGSKLKETGTTHWAYPNTGATNFSSFTGISGGDRRSTGTFEDIDYYGYWWSASDEDSYSAWRRGLSYDSGKIGRGAFSKGDGYSIRCIKD